MLISYYVPAISSNASDDWVALVFVSAATSSATDLARTRGAQIVTSCARLTFWDLLLFTIAYERARPHLYLSWLI
eukprot:106055-Pleurochrysis_carterae.AAC.3